MAENSYIRRNWKLLLNIITVAALVILTVALWPKLVQTLKNLERVNAWFVLLIIPIELINYHAQARLYQRLFGIIGNKLDYKFLYRTAVELNFVNHVFPSGGVSGVSYLSLRLRNKEVRASKSALVQVMKFVMTFLAFEIILLIGVFALALEGSVNNFTILVAGSLSTALIVGTLLFTYIIGSRQRINRTFEIAYNAINKVIHLLRLGKPETIKIERIRGVIDELHDDYVLYRSELNKLKAPLFYAFLADLTEVLAVYVVYLAFGHWINFGAVVLAYAVANFAGLISVTPGGIGVYEALMAGVMVSAGVPATLSIPVTVMYRVVSIIVQVPVGFLLYNRTIQNEGK